MVDREQTMRVVYRYHDATKHHYHRFARSLGYLDWETQPHPFRNYHGARRIALPFARNDINLTYDELYAVRPARPQPLRRESVAEFLRYGLGLSAWKQYGQSRWSLRVNPSSGNLHPTEGYLLLPSIDPWSERAAVYHYQPEHHELELRSALPAEAWSWFQQWLPEHGFLMGLSSIYWREAWKYGERAFRYCQHDCGHAIAALRFSAALQGWNARLLPQWSTAAVAALLGVDRRNDFHPAEHEAAECLMLVYPSGTELPAIPPPDDSILSLVKQSEWAGRAGPLSADYVHWDIIDAVSEATQSPGMDIARESVSIRQCGDIPSSNTTRDARRLILQRRSAVDFDPRAFTGIDTFVCILRRTLPSAGAPWDALFWPPRVHLLVFVHRVRGLSPGIYCLCRNPEALDTLRAASRPDLLWKQAPEVEKKIPFYLLREGDVRNLAASVSCHQAIAGDGFFSLGMIAEWKDSLDRYGPWFYRNLFWETGVIGQVLYLEAENQGIRGTGIGCYFDDPVHEILGLRDMRYQSLYHFTVGVPVDDPRLTTHPAYAHERSMRHG